MAGYRGLSVPDFGLNKHAAAETLRRVALRLLWCFRCLSITDVWLRRAGLGELANAGAVPRRRTHRRLFAL